MSNQQPLPPLSLEIAAALLVPAACVGFLRVFEDPAVIVSVAGAALLSSTIAIVTRRLRVPLIVTAAVSLGLLVVLLMNRYAPGTAVLGVIPTGQTSEAIRSLLGDLVRDFRALVSPVPALPPFVAASMVAAWLMAFLTDWGAMRLRLAFEPVLPAGLIFLFTSIPPISSGENQLLPPFVLGAVVAIWGVTQRWTQLRQLGVWLPGHDSFGPSAIATLGAVFAAFAVVAGLVLGPRLPGADADPVYSFESEAEAPRKVPSPFVNIRNRLVDQTDTEMFRVAADTRSYWRIAGLDTYQSSIWQVSADFSPESGRLPGQTDYGNETAEVVQDFSITGMSAIWLPAAFAPAEILSTSDEVTWNAETSSLTVADKSENASSDGLTYSLLSKVPSFSAEQLQASSGEMDADFAETYLRLPDALTPVVETKAREITAGTTTRYEKALALQNHFRSYDYSLDLNPVAGDPIEQFLRERVGFCQQFAGVYALMARSLGIPARVATGFTWGDPLGADPATGRTVYQVTGRHTHAWPEVYFEGLGWVAFEPTPGRGLPGASDYTQQEARQDSPTEATPPQELPPEADPEPEQPATPPTTQAPAPEQAQPDVAPNPEERPDGDFAIPVPWWTLLLLALLAGYGALAWWSSMARSRSRHQAAESPATRVEALWADASDALELGFGYRQQKAETHVEFAERLVPDHRVASAPLAKLADLATIARFYPAGISDQSAGQAAEWSNATDDLMKSQVSIVARCRRHVSPRRIFAILFGRALPVRPESPVPDGPGAVTEEATTSADVLRNDSLTSASKAPADHAQAVGD